MFRSFTGPVPLSVVFVQLGCLASGPEPRTPERRQTSEVVAPDPAEPAEAAAAPAAMARPGHVPRPEVPENNRGPGTLLYRQPIYFDILPAGLLGDVGPDRLATTCHMKFKTSAGVELFMIGSFALCPGNSRDMTPLIDKKVVLTTVFGRYQDHGCEKDPACPRDGAAINVEADLVRDMVAAP